MGELLVQTLNLIMQQNSDPKLSATYSSFN